jgi:dihydrodipicolinate synthase/N-acetylneuraminate lyase
VKAAMELLGGAGGPVRPPGTQVRAEDRPAIAGILRKHSEVTRLDSVLAAGN